MSALIIKSSGTLLFTGTGIAAHADCCCGNNNTTNCASHLENCAGGVAPLTLNATVSITDSNGICASCTSEANGTHVLSQFRAAESQTAYFLDPHCDGGIGYDILDHCYWEWINNHTFAPNGNCTNPNPSYSAFFTMNEVDISISLAKFSDGYRCFGWLIFVSSASWGERLNVDQAFFLSDVIDTSPIDCPTALNGVVLNFVCATATFYPLCIVTGTITLGVP